MSDPLETQIRNYAVFLDKHQRVVDITALQECGVAERPVRADQRPVPGFTEPWPEFEEETVESRPSLWDVLMRPRVFTALMVVMAVPVAVALVLTLSSSDTDSPPRAEGGGGPAASPGSAGDAPVANPPTAPVATPAPAVSALAWSRVPHDEAVFGGDAEAYSMQSVTAGGPGLVAVGFESTRETNDQWHAAVWTSVDGISWSRVPHDEAVFGGDKSWVADVTAGGPGLVAVGSSARNAEVWTSVDGVTWSRVARQDSLLRGGMSSVTVGGPGLVAVGGSADGESAAVWTSVDGFTWSLVPHDEAVFGGPDEVLMWSVTAGGPGLVAVGSDGGFSDERTLAATGSAVVWTSVDGLSWSRVPHDEMVFGGELGQQMSSVTVGGPGLVAVGFDTPASRTRTAAVWTSVDGLSWSRVPQDETVFGTGGYSAMSDLVATEAGLVAVGDGDVWTSVDGLTWSRTEASFVGQGPDSVTATDSGLVAVGQSADGAAVWVAAGE